MELITAEDSFRQAASLVLERIKRSTFGNNIELALPFRTEGGPSVKLRTKFAAAERLVCWDSLHPKYVFRDGFAPAYAKTDYQQPEAYNLRKYLDTEMETIFVTTVRPRAGSTEDELLFWRPDISDMEGSSYFEYEIFAYGGIDIDQALGPQNDSGRGEVVFPGGIRTQFIRAAREYKGLELVKIWDNPRFDNTANGPGRSPPLKTLPDPMRPLGIPVIFFPSLDDGIAPSTRIPLMGRPGGWYPVPVEPEQEQPPQLPAPEPAPKPAPKPVPEQDEKPPPTPLPLIVRSAISTASVLHPFLTDQAIFFCGNRFAVVAASPSDDLASTPESVVSQTIESSWPSLVKADMGNVDGMLPDPHDPHTMHVFCLNKYTRINLRADLGKNELVAKKTDLIVNAWPSLKKAKFEKIDAVLPDRVDSGCAYVFSREQYVHIRLKARKAAEALLEGPKSIEEGWPALKNAGIKYVDTALAHPRNPAQAYFFCGDYYVLANATPGVLETVQPRLVEDDWPSLVQAGFW